MRKNKRKQKKIYNRVCFVAGKSGGHIIPAITLAKKLITKNKHTQILFFSTNSTLDHKIIKEAQEALPTLSHITLSLENIPYKKILLYPMFFARLTISFLKSFFKLVTKRPEKIVSMGGYISIPVCLAAFLLKIPIELFELNATPGKAVKFLAPFATKIKVCFEKAIEYLPKKKCILSAYPIRFENLGSAHLAHKNLEQCILKYGLCPQVYTILVLGGSQGSISINNLIKQLFISNPHLAQHIQIIHQTGDKDTTDWNDFYKKVSVKSHVFQFNSAISTYYQIANTVICRSGAGTLFETIFFEKKCITIPLETATTAHQVDNAKEIERRFPDLVTMVRKQEGASKLDSVIQKHLQSYGHIPIHSSNKTQNAQGNILQI
ncbi:glycosyltransferase [Candidatus Dependentiae bacterium]